MLKLLLLLFLCVASSAFMFPESLLCLFQGSSLPLMNAFASKNGTVKVYDIGTNLSNVDVDFASPIFRKDNADYFPFNAQMKIALYTNETILVSAKTSVSFVIYDCEDEKTGCVRSQDRTQVGLSFPQFNISGTRAKVNLFVDYNYWNQESEVLLGTSVSKKSPTLTYPRMYGIIGMGIEGKAYDNLKNTNVFSIFFDESGNGKLFFEQNLNYAREVAPVAILTTTTNWHVQDLDMYCLGQYCSEVGKFKLIFDVNSNLIHLPLVFYQQLLMVSFKKYGLNCSSTYDQFPQCEFKGLIKNLPNIILKFGHQKIILPPRVYVQNAKDVAIQSRITLLFTHTVNLESKPENYMTPQFQNCIVLGLPFMNNYYTVFNKQKQTVSIYNPNYGPSYWKDDILASRSSRLWVYILASVIIAILMFVLCRKLKKRRANFDEDLKEAFNPIPVAQEVGTVNETFSLSESSMYDETVPQL